MLPRRIASRWFLVAGLVVLAGLAFGYTRLRPRLAAGPRSLQTRFTNSAPEVKYVGVEACASCHAEAHRSYLQTNHSRAMSPIDLAQEPPDAEFTHELSGHKYRVAREGGQLHHQEWLTGNGEPLLLADHAVRYSIGSGRQGRTYLVDRSGFLTESPITWYTARDAWGMSPGFDRAVHRSFERPVTQDCLFCHAGRTEMLDGSLNKLTVHETSIGCERCHGPGERHVAAHEGNRKAPTDQTDFTIVNPRRLTREESVGVCAQCHMSSGSESDVPGRRMEDFRPSQDLADYRRHFAPKDRSGGMNVVGHVEQMRLSKCYTMSETMTCITCHDPHSTPSVNDRFNSFRGRCLTCHDEQACGVPVEKRLQQTKTGRDDCVSCHMPSSKTDIPHVASHHHRIGIHPAPTGDAEEPSGGVDELVPLDGKPGDSPQDRERFLGLAYLEYAGRHKERSDDYLERSRKLLERVQRHGINDGVIEAALAQIHYDFGRYNDAEDHARRAMADPQLTPFSRDAALWILGDVALRQSRPAEAVAPLEQLVRRNSNSTHELALAQACYRSGQLEKSIEALKRAAASNAGRSDVQSSLAQALREQGDIAAADAQDKLVHRLQQLLKRTDRQAPGESGR